jgi:hypothetical protein
MHFIDRLLGMTMVTGVVDAMDAVDVDLLKAYHKEAVENDEGDRVPEALEFLEEVIKFKELTTKLQEKSEQRYQERRTRRTLEEIAQRDRN